MWVKQRCAALHWDNARLVGQYSRADASVCRWQARKWKKEGEKNYTRKQQQHRAQSSICWQVNVLAYISVARQSAHSWRLPSRASVQLPTSEWSASQEFSESERQNTERRMSPQLLITQEKSTMQSDCRMNDGGNDTSLKQMIFIFEVKWWIYFIVLDRRQRNSIRTVTLTFVTAAIWIIKNNLLDLLQVYKWPILVHLKQQVVISQIIYCGSINWVCFQEIKGSLKTDLVGQNIRQEK